VDTSITTIPPAQMVAQLEAGNIDGYCIGEPWNTRAAVDGIGYEIATDLEIWDGHPGKVLGVREDWALAYPNTHVALVKALLEACRYCMDPANHDEVREMLSRPEYLDTELEHIYLGIPDTQTSLKLSPREYAHHQFFGPGVNRPSRTEHLWLMTQMARWGDIPFPRNWVEILERICNVSVFSIAARELGLADVTYSRGPIKLFDGVTFTADDPIAYLNNLAIKHDIYMAEVPLGTPGRRIAA
jgi:NMT1-like family